MQKILIILITVLLVSSVSANENDSKKTIKGNVYEMVDGVKRPLPMAFVFVKKSDACSHSNFYGEFAINLPKNAKELSISYEGFKKQTIKVNRKTDALEVILKRDASAYFTDK